MNNRFKLFKDFLINAESTYVNEWKVSNSSQIELSTILNKSISFNYIDLDLCQVIGETIYTFRKSNFDHLRSYLFFEDRIISKIYDKSPELICSYLSELKTKAPEVFMNLSVDLKNMANHSLEIKEIEFSITPLRGQKIH